MQTLMFDPGGFKGRLRAYPYLRTWRTLLCRFFFFLSGVAGGDLECFFYRRGSSDDPLPE